MLALQLPPTVESVGADLLQLAAIVGAVGVILAAWWKTRRHLARPARWLWRKLWRDDHGNHYGPAERARTLVRSAVDPMIQASMAASREQHDQQNVRLDGIEQRLVSLEEFVTTPKPQSRKSA